MANKDESKNRIYEVREYRTPDGRHIVAQTPLDGSAIIYVGHSVGQVKNAAGQVGQIPYTFIIEAETVEQAFENGKAANAKAWTETIEQFKRQHAKQQKRIVTVGAMDDAAREMLSPGGNGQGLRIAK